MKFLLQYLKNRIGILSVLTACVIILLSVFALYRLPIEAIVYALLLCGVLLFSYGAYDYIKQYKKHKILLQLSSLPENILEVLSSYNTIDDKDYYRIISLLKDYQRKVKTDSHNRYWDMIDYYTTWVHQIKTPISSMYLTLQNQDDATSRKLRDDLFRIEQYVEMVLAYLRIDSLSTDYVFAKHSLDHIVKQSIRKFAGQFITLGIHLEYSPVNAEVVTDEKWMTFVIEQVLSNALKYTPEGSVTIYLENDSFLCIRDTGIGISKEDLPRIFEKGYTGYNGRSNKKSSGLGLYLCKKICDNLGHSISAYSDEKGTTIKIDFTQYNERIE
ncbi:MAG: ATP-binding protein [Ruminococcus sp.]